MTINERFAVIDIGSNSIRLVVYGGPLRAPSVLFNEKVMAGLGVGVQQTGAIDAKAMAAALPALARFQQLAALMGVDQPRTVATAAVRQANNGDAFLHAVRQLGLNVELLSGHDEARIAGLGVISGFVEADGIVGDLGGGSLELARIKDGQVHQLASFPLGVQRIAAIRGRARRGLTRYLVEQLGQQGWGPIESGLPFYLVGGSWRALAKLHMHLARYPLPILHHYQMPPQAAVRLVRATARIERPALKALALISGQRIPALPDAAALLQALVKTLSPNRLIVSATGLREGLLFEGLAPSSRRQDPLIIATRAEGARQGRFAEHGDQVHRWIEPLFGDETAELARIRHAACLLSDIGWAANPDFRAERAFDAALQGNWIGIDARGRAMMAHALHTAFGGDIVARPVAGQLVPAEDLARARGWGLAIRLGQRLTGGVAQPLTITAIDRSDGVVTLRLGALARDLGGETVERRLRQLATALACRWQISVAA